MQISPFEKVCKCKKERWMEEGIKNEKIRIKKWGYGTQKKRNG
jgi:hypothetical protein